MRSSYLFLMAFVILLIWWLVAPHVNPFILPSPQAVFSGAFDLLRSGELFSDLSASTRRVVLGFCFSVVIGTPLGLAMALSPFLKGLVDPILQFLRPIPPIAWIPLTILWFGLGEGPAYALTAIASFFPIVLGTYFGASEIDSQHLAVARVVGASFPLRLRYVIWPATLPSILQSYRIGFGIAWMAVMAAEMVAAQSGLGHLIANGQNMVRTDLVFVGMMTIGLAGYLFDRAFVKLHSRVIRWRKS